LESLPPMPITRDLADVVAFFEQLGDRRGPSGRGL
jgi:hypothetical protein